MAENPATALRMALARRAMDQYAASPGFRAGILTGSVALGLADDASDLDIVLYYDSIPSLEALDAIRLALGGERLLFAFGAPEEGSCVQSFLLEGVKTDVAHATLARWKEDAADVLVAHNAESPMQKALSGLLESIPLAGGEVVEELRREAAYPDGLAVAVVARHLKFYPPWALREQAADRGDALYFHELLTGEVAHLINVLCGVNRIYHWGELKHSDHLLSRMKVAPDRCRETLGNLYRMDMGEAADSLDRLIRATFDIVDSALPDADVAKARQRYETPGRG